VVDAGAERELRKELCRRVLQAAQIPTKERKENASAV